MLGAAAAAKGSVSVENGQWTTGDLTVGGLGQGSVTVNQGSVHSGAVTIGADAGSSGNVALQAGTWTAGATTIGDAGTGTFDLSGSLTSAAAVIGNQQKGTVTIESGGSWTATASLLVGAQGSGSLTINTGGSASVAGDVQIANSLKSTGAADVNGGRWDVGGNIAVAPGGAGTLSVENGGQLTSAGAQVGGVAGSAASALVDGSGSNWTTAGAIGVGGLGGSALLEVSGGATLVASEVNVGAGGTLAGQGVVGNVINNGGTVTPTDGPGLMLIKGNYTQNSGTLLFDILGSSVGEFDQLHVGGFAALKGGKIEIDFGGGFTPFAGEQFDLISATGGLSASNVSFDVPGLPTGLKFDETFGSNGLDVSFVTAAVPEPDTGLLCGSGLALLIILTGRRYGPPDNWHRARRPR